MPVNKGGDATGKAKSGKWGGFIPKASKKARVEQATKAVAKVATTKHGALADAVGSVGEDVKSVAPRGKRYIPPRLIDPILSAPDKHGKQHYAKGTGNLVESRTTTALRRLLSPTKSVGERDLALSDLQRRGKLPSDDALAALLHPPKAEPKKHESNIKKILKDAAPALPVIGPTLVAGGAASKAAPFLAKELGTGSHELTRILSEVNRRTGGGDTYKMRTGGVAEFKPGERIKRAVEHGALAAGSGVLEGLDRPVGASEAVIGKALADSGVVQGKLAQKIKHAKGPVDVLLHGRSHTKDVSGADIAQSVGLPKQVGLGVDLATDPLLYAGVILAPETGGGSLALTLQRIRRVAPEILDAPEVVRASRAFNRTSDEKAYRKALQSAYKRHLATNPNRNADIEATIAEGRKAGARILTKKGERPIAVPSRSGKAAVTQALRNAEGRGVKPQLRLQSMLPTGRTVVRGKQLPGVTLPVDLSGIPARRLKGARRAAMETNIARQARADVTEAETAKLKGIDRALRMAKADKDADRYRLLQSQQEEIKAGIPAKVEAEIAKRTDEIPRFRTIGDIVTEHNGTKAAHLATLQSSEFGRTIQANFSRALEEATKVLDKEGGKLGMKATDKATSLKRVQLALYATEGQGGVGRHILEEAGIHLSDAEQTVYHNYRTIYDEMLRHGKETGVLEKGIKNYAGYRVWDKIDDPNAATDEVLRGFTNASAAYTRHRSIHAISDFADPVELTKALEAAGATPEAARIAAEKLYRNGRVRALQEMTVRKIQRGQPVYWNDLSPAERNAIKASDGGVGIHDTPLFKHPGNNAHTEGLVVPNANTWDKMDLHMQDLGEGADATEAQLRALYSAHVDYKQVKSWLEHAPEDEFEGLQQLAENLRTEMLHHDPESAAIIEGRQIGLDAEVAALHAQGAAKEVSTLGQLHALDRGRADIAHHLEELDNAAPAAGEVPPWKNLHQGVGEEWSRMVSGHKQTVVRTGKSSFRAEVETPQTLKGHGVGADIANPYADNVSYRFKNLEDAQRALDEHMIEHDYVPVVDNADDVEAERSELLKLDEELKAQRDQLHDAGFADAQAKYDEALRTQVGGIKLDDIPPGNATLKLDEHGNAWLSGTHAYSHAMPVEGMKPRSAFEVDAHSDPFDYTSRLPESRSAGGALPELDPRVTGYIRSRSQGIASAFKARWEAVDATYGRSTTEYENSKYIVKETGEEGSVLALEVEYAPDGTVAAFMTPEGIIHAPDELELPRASLIPNSDRSVWFDPLQNQEYVSPQQLTRLSTELMVDGIPADRVWPTQMVNDLSQAAAEARGVTRDIYQTGLESGYARILSTVRYGVTSPFPAYHIRNLISDLLKSLQADTGVLFHPVVNYKLTKAAFNRGLGRDLNVPGLPNMKLEDFLFLADSVGIRTGHHAAEVMQMAKTGQFSESELLRLHQKYNPLYSGGPITKFGAHREDIVRYMTFMQRLRHNGGDAADAAWYTIRHHFNYNDLTAGEKTFARNVFLFYTWYRKNLPLQMAELARRPGFFAAVESSYNALAQGESPLNVGLLSGAAPPQPALPDYVHDRNQAATFNWNGYAVNVAFGAPWSDLELASKDGVGELFSMINPLLQGSMEAGYAALTGNNGVDPLTGREFKNREPGGIVNAADAAYHAVTGQHLSKDKNGQYVLPWWEVYALRSVPFLGRGTFNLTQKRDTQPDTKLQKYGGLLSNVTGLSIFESPHPGSVEESTAMDKIGKGYAAERKDLVGRLSNEGGKGTPYFDKKLKALDKKQAEEAARRGIDLKHVKGTKPYIKKKRRSTSSFGSGFGGNGFGGGF